MTMTTETFTVFSVSDVTSKLNKASKKYGFTYELVENGDTEISLNQYQGLDDEWGYSEEVTVKMKNITVSFSFPSYKIEGFTYLGCVKNEVNMGFITVHGNELAGENTLSTFVKDLEKIPCSHCGKNHKRIIGHIFRQDETGDLKVYGSQCAKDYFGVDFAKLVTSYPKMIESCFCGCSNGPDYVNRSVASAIAYYFITKTGYVSRAACSDRNPATSDDIKNTYCAFNSMCKLSGAALIYYRELHKEVFEMAKDINFEEKIAAFEVEGNNDFSYNIRTVKAKYLADRLTYRDLGFFGYLVNMIFFKEVKKAEKVVYNDNPSYNEGDKISGLELTFKEKKCFERTSFSYYDSGISYLYKFVDEKTMTVFTWFSANEINFELNQVLEVKKATVKKIDRNEKYGVQVVLTRVSFK
jgi:hypothetical protein